MYHKWNELCGVGQLDLWYSDDFENEDQNTGGHTQFAVW